MGRNSLAGMTMNGAIRIVWSTLPFTCPAKSDALTTTRGVERSQCIHCTGFLGLQMETRMLAVVSFAYCLTSVSDSAMELLLQALILPFRFRCVLQQNMQ